LAAAIARCCANSALTISIAGTAIMIDGGRCPGGSCAPGAAPGAGGANDFGAGRLGMFSLPLFFMFFLYELL
jgi:hypothetical protein